MTFDRILFLRHGETDYNAQQRFQGQVDIDLNETGRAQAQAAAGAIAKYLGRRRSVILSSDLSRAQQTAQYCAAELGIPVSIDPRLRERGFGAFEGLSRAELEVTYPAQFQLWLSGQTPDGIGIEEIGAVAERMVAAVEEQLGSQQALPTSGQDLASVLLVVSHGSAITQTLRHLLDVADIAGPIWRGMDNCCWTDLERGNFGGNASWRMRAHNISVR